MAAINLRIPEDVVRALKVPPPEAEATLRRELAVALYAREILSHGKARELAGLTFYEFEDLLRKRGIAAHYGEKDLEEDLAYAGGDR